ncbi:MAG TPA: Ppx/GppA phosphatase family protein [Solirubrobacteraceae bacterium]
MRVAVVDIGTNSTRLFVADVAPDAGVETIERRSEVTRLGEGVDRAGRLTDEAMGRVHAVLDSYRSAIDELHAEAAVAVLTSAVRDAANGSAFVDEVAKRHRLDARVITGDEEAELTFLGAVSERPHGAGVPTVVLDVGGGSTELVVGTGRDMRFHVSTQVGVVRMTERHLHDDPPPAEALAALRDDVRDALDDGLPASEREDVCAAIAVAGTATSLAAIDLALDPYDPDRVHGHVLSVSRIEELRDQLAAIRLAQRREVRGLHPDRAPTIVAGVVILLEALAAFGLDTVEVSEHDILRGVALRRAGAA